MIAPLPQAQLVETRVINLLQYQTLVASKAARSVLVAPTNCSSSLACDERMVPRRLSLAARASYMAGFQGTSNVLAGMKYGIPTYGTMAHSFIQRTQARRKRFSILPDRISTMLYCSSTRTIPSGAPSALSMSRKSPVRRHRRAGRPSR